MHEVIVDEGNPEELFTKGFWTYLIQHILQIEHYPKEVIGYQLRVHKQPVR